MEVSTRAYERRGVRKLEDTPGCVYHGMADLVDKENILVDAPGEGMVAVG